MVPTRLFSECVQFMMEKYKPLSSAPMRMNILPHHCSQIEKFNNETKQYST